MLHLNECNEKGGSTLTVGEVMRGNGVRDGADAKERLLVRAVTCLPDVNWKDGKSSKFAGSCVRVCKHSHLFNLFYHSVIVSLCVVIIDINSCSAYT